MKKLKLILALAITGFITMSMGFPTDLTNDRIRDESEKTNCTLATLSNVVVMSRAEFGNTNMQKRPIQELSTRLAIELSHITVKVFDAKGTMVVNRQISMDEFLANSKNLYLPNGSTFVMFHKNTAYYFLEAGLMN